MTLGSIREQLYGTAPPRGLYCAFPLGRPLGVPNDPTFQHRVLARAFRLLEATSPTVVDYGETITDDPEARGLVGISSSGVCAFAACWNRPDAFRKCISHVGSFTNIRGAHNFPYLVRTTPRKPIRVFMQSGTHDFDNSHGSWSLANQTLAQSLHYAGYNYEFVSIHRRHNVHSSTAPAFSAEPKCCVGAGVRRGWAQHGPRRRAAPRHAALDLVGLPGCEGGGRGHGVRRRVCVRLGAGTTPRRTALDTDRSSSALITKVFGTKSVS